MRLDNELAVITKTYTLATGRRFSLDVLSNPWQTPTTWAYIYSWQARNHGLMPAYRGITAYTFPGENSLPRSDSATSIEFTIVEPGVSQELVKQTLASEQNKSTNFSVININTIQLWVMEHV